MKSEVRLNGHTHTHNHNIIIHTCTQAPSCNLMLCCHLDLHAELTRQNKKKNQKMVGLPSQVASSDNHGVGPETPTHSAPPLNQAHPPDSNTVPVPMDTSPLIKANPSPQGTPLHTTFTGTQRFTPSTRISALNMVGDLLRKVGVRLIRYYFYANMSSRNGALGTHPSLNSALQGRNKSKTCFVRFWVNIGRDYFCAVLVILHVWCGLDPTST